jgi:polysaccharide export outer membrane protein
MIRQSWRSDKNIDLQLIYYPMSSCKSFRFWSVVFGLLFAILCFSGCQTGSSGSNYAAFQTGAAGGSEGASTLSDGGNTEIINIGDSLTVIFSDAPVPEKNFEVRVNEEGTITLIQNEKFVAVGKTRGQLEKEIRERYVPRYYVRMTVTIVPKERVYYVDGEVRQAGPKFYTQPITILKAIASAGGFTDFAKKTKVSLTRLNGKKQTINCEKALKDPRLDVPVYPGDTIYVRRRIF